MTAPNEAQFPLGVSLHTLDPEQRLDAIGLLGASTVKAVELWEPTFRKDEDFLRAAHRALAKAGVEPRTVHAAFDTTLDISSLDPAVRSAGMEAVGMALDLVVRMGARMVVVHPSSDYDGVDEKHWPPLRGVIDWAAFLAALRAASFSGPFHYEATLDGQTPMERLAFLETNFSQLQRATVQPPPLQSTEA